jgi:proteic killer suppression protein
MIKSFKDKNTEKLFYGTRVKKFQAFEEQARRRLKILDATVSLEALFLLPSNKAHALGGTRDNQYAIWINNQWRLCFYWKDGHAEEVEIVDYH